MFNKLKWIFSLIILALPYSKAFAEETIDAFARLNLMAAEVAKSKEDTGEKEDARIPLVANRPAVQRFEVLYIQGVDGVKKAYLLVDNKYAKTVQKGEIIRDWRVSVIGDEHVDITKAGKKQRLLLNTQLDGISNITADEDINFSKENVQKNF